MPVLDDPSPENPLPDSKDDTTLDAATAAAVASSANSAPAAGEGAQASAASTALGSVDATDHSGSGGSSSGPSGVTESERPVDSVNKGQRPKSKSSAQKAAGRKRVVAKTKNAVTKGSDRNRRNPPY